MKMNEMDLTTFTCRTCLSIYDTNEMVTNPTNLQLQIQTCIPELTLDIIKDYVVCRECIQSLLLAYKFKKMCLETEEKIYDYMFNSSSKGKAVDISSVVQWNVDKETNSSIETIDLVDNISEESEICSNCDEEDKYDLIEIEKHELDDDFKGFLVEETTTVATTNYRKLCEIEDRFANYSIDEFYSKGVVKLPECSVVLDRLSRDVVQKYCENTSVVKEITLTKKKVTRKRRKTKFHWKKKSNRVNTSIKATLPNLQCARYKCTKCSYFTIYEDSLFYHLKRHDQQLRGRIADCTTFKCVECDYETRSQQYLKSHYKTVHYERPPFLCKICKLNFKLLRLLINHLIGHSEGCGVIETEHNYAIV